MIEKFAIVSGEVSSEFLDLNHTSKAMTLVSLMIPKFTLAPAANAGELRNRDTSVMIEKFAISNGEAASEFLDLNHTSKSMLLVSLMIPKLDPDPAANSGELRNRDTSGRVDSRLGLPSTCRDRPLSKAQRYEADAVWPAAGPAGEK